MEEYDENEHDMYVSQLKEVFKSCDSYGNGALNKADLEKLCLKLQLEEQTDVLISQLLNENESKKVTFEEFKEGFVAVLSTAVEGISSDEEVENESNCEPMPSQNKKTYGRKSLPQEKNDTNSGIYDHSEMPLVTASANNEKIEQQSSVTKPLAQKTAETYEAEGEMEATLDPVSEEEHLKEIWKELNVGKSGYLDLAELASVCEHIGMDEMNKEELEHLFAKLDSDADGLVSFQEFLQGLFQHGSPMTGSPLHHSRLTSPVRTLSTPRLTRGKGTPSYDDRRTPSYVTYGSGLFSEIDLDNTGFTSYDSVIEMWEGLGIEKGADILQFLQFDSKSIINLAELSSALEQELHTVENDSAIYHAAVVTYENEIQYLRNTADHLSAERNKLKIDLQESSHRLSVLVKEGDDRHLALEKAKQTEVQKVENKLQEKLRSVVQETERERESLLHQASKQQLKLNTEIKTLKKEEVSLREKVLYLQKELDKMEEEMYDVMENSSELQKQNSLLSKELQKTNSVAQEFEDIESHEQETFSGQNFLQLEQENKSLKDRNDELAIQVEELNQKIASSKKTRRGLHQRYLEGSYLNRLTKLPSGEDESGDEASQPLTVTTELKQQHALEIQELEAGFITERKDIEDMFKLEIADLEDQHMREKNDMHKKFNQEKDALEAEFAHKLEESLIEKERNLKEVFDHEAQNTEIIHQSEKTLLQENFAREKADAIKKLHEEFDIELNHKLQEQKAEYMRELEQTVTRDGSQVNEDYKKQVAEMQLQLKLQEQELNAGYQQKQAKLQEDFEQQMGALKERHRLDILKYENMLAKGVEGLQGKLKTDFKELLELHKHKVSQEEKHQLSAAMDLEKDEIIEEFTRQQEQIVKKLKEERKEAEQKNRCAITQLKNTLDNERQQWERERQQIELQAKQSVESPASSSEQLSAAAEVEKLKAAVESERRRLEVERVRLQAQYEAAVCREREQIEQERNALKNIMEEDISRELHAQMEDEFLDQMERVKLTFRDEQLQLEDQVHMLQNELEEINKTRDMEESFREKMQTRSKELETSYKKQVADLKRNNQLLKQENEQLEKELYEKTSAVEEAITSRTVHMSPGNNHQFLLLFVQKEHEHLLEEKRQLQTEICELQKALQDTQQSNLQAEQYRAQLEQWEKERLSLEHQLEMSTDKLAHINTSMSLKDSEHLREIHELNGKLSQMVCISKYNNLNSKLMESEEKAKQLAQALDEKTTETNKFIESLRSEHISTMERLQQEKDGIEQKLQVTRQLLDTQVKKLKQQLNYASHLDVLVKELYVENSNLMKCLEMCERRGVSAEMEAHELQGKCSTLNRVMKNVATSALR